jgi:uncharacterized membrane protein
MRFVMTVILAALLLLVLYVMIGAIVDGYFGGNMIPNRFVPDSWSAPNSWEQWRDIVIVFAGLWFALAFFLTCVLLIALIILVFTIRGLLKNKLGPAIDSLKESLDNVKGTSEFVGETAVAPIVRVYSVVRGVRGGIGAITNLPDRIRGRQKKKKKR